jgi:uncharacterized protein YqgQ
MTQNVDIDFHSLWHTNFNDKEVWAECLNIVKQRQKHVKLPEWI